MSGSGSDGQQQQQMHLGAPQQMQHPQMQPQMHPQMRPQAVIRQTMPVHMQQGQNIVRMQRPQVVNSGQKDNVVSAASPVFGLANGGPRVIVINKPKVITRSFSVRVFDSASTFELMCRAIFNSMSPFSSPFPCCGIT